jgi:hypothetical protein
MRPGTLNSLVRMDLVVMGTAAAPSPIWLTHRPRLWAMTLSVVQAALAPKRPEGKWLRPTPYFRSLMTSSTTAWRRWSASSSMGSSQSVVARIEQGDRDVSTLARYAAAVGRRVTWSVSKAKAG